MSSLQTASSECRLQQSLSTPCPHEDQPSRKDSEYRRFKSEGSSAGALPAGPEMEVAIDDLSPIADARSTPPHRFNLIAINYTRLRADSSGHSHLWKIFEK
ncbi:hypothetical protein ANCDUO_02099 [Ancylostoma duodenale]|uniref:Uncharacterized protein n=1 Tax=Ancylostoma duodenale TaxID=51022 RepID=A0A0C2DCI4_9BILA|nr:hypothetical protein ANCDUO_02099 [Ancylostoma duodenale]